MTPEEVQRAKTKMRRGSRLCPRLLPDGRASDRRRIGDRGNLADVEEWPQRIAAVTPEQVNEAARAILREERSVTGTLVPAKAGEGPPVEPGSAQPPSTLGRQIR